uniref:SSD domain-containing protein n=1 Tax=Clytia hemisphaerica TaxID=252671 RepID=A0A7M5XG14_9CNID
GDKVEIQRRYKITGRLDMEHYQGEFIDNVNNSGMVIENESESAVIYKNYDNLEKEFPPEDNDSIQFFFKRTHSYRNGTNEDEDDDSLTNSTTKDNDKTKTLLYKLCTLYVQKPKTIFALTLFLQICFVVVTGALHLTNYDIFPYYFANVPLCLEKDSTKLRTDAYNYVTEDPRIDLLPVTALPQLERSKRQSPLELIYEPLSDNILTQASLNRIKAVENELYTNPHFQNVCQKNYQIQRCEPPMSLLRLFDGSFAHLNQTFHDPQFKRIKQVLILANELRGTRSLVAFTLDKHSIISKETIKSKYLRSVISHGLPLRGFKHSEDRKNIQMQTLKETIVKAFSMVLSNKYKEGIGGDIRIYYNNMNLFFDAVEKQVTYDLLLTGGSLIFIFGFIWFQTGSLWITGWAVFGIITNFFGANLVYRIAFDFKFIGMFHVLSIFIILGIGADDIFVFFNTWKLMENKHFASLEEHLYETFRVAAGAMFVTSFTTAAAFFASATSPLLGVSSFGVFSGILVIVNYLSVCVYFPSVIVTYHYYWKECTPMCRSRKKEQNLITPLDDEIEGVTTHEAPHDDMSQMFRRVVHWLETSYANGFVLHKKWRLLIMLVCGIVSITFLVFAIRIEPQDEMVQVWPNGTNWHDIHYIKLNSFQETGEGTDVIRVYTVWGLKLQDRSTCHHTDFRCKGRTVLDEEFDMNQPGCQQAVLNFCKRLKNLAPEEAEDLRIRRSVATNQLEVECFIEEMDQYFRSDDFNDKMKYHQKHHSLSDTNATFKIPMTKEDIKRLMDTLPKVYNTSLLTNDYKNYFEIALGYWLTSGGNPGYNFDKYSSYMGGNLDLSTGNSGIYTQAQGGRYGNKLRYVAVVANTSLTGTKLKHSEGVRVSNNWETFVTREMKKMPKGCNKGFQCTPEWFNWHWLKVQEELLQGAKQGIIIGLCVAFPVLVITTLNWVVGVFAIVTIALITISVIGLIPMLGWKLGVLESLNLTLVVGLSVDYVVHLADGYVRCTKFSRAGRTRYMLGHVGVSVLAGAATTLGASSFMLGSKILFFYQFGIFIFCTIGFSIVYALLVFTVLIGFCGPQGNSGGLTFLKDYFVKKKRKKRACRKTMNILNEDSQEMENMDAVS